MMAAMGCMSADCRPRRSSSDHVRMVMCKVIYAEVVCKIPHVHCRWLPVRESAMLFHDPSQFCQGYITPEVVGKLWDPQGQYAKHPWKARNVLKSRFLALAGLLKNTMRPGYLSPSAGLKFADIPNGLAAISKVPTAGWAQIAAYFGFVEFSGGFDDYKTGTPGDYGFKVLTSSDPAEKTKKLSAELANGRLAMMAIIGMFFQDKMPREFFGVMS